MNTVHDEGPTGRPPSRLATVSPEPGTGLDAPTLYHADIFAEKRTILTEAERADRLSAEAREDRVKQRHYRRLWAGLMIAAAVGLLVYALAVSPLIRAILSLF